MNACICAEPTSEAELLARLDEVIVEMRQLPGALIPVSKSRKGSSATCGGRAQRIAQGLGKSYSESPAWSASTVSFPRPLGAATPSASASARPATCAAATGARDVQAVPWRRRRPDDAGPPVYARSGALPGRLRHRPGRPGDNAVHQSIKPNNIPTLLHNYSRPPIVATR